MSYRYLSIEHPHMHGEDIAKLQRADGRRIEAMGLDDFGIPKPAVDRDMGTGTLEVTREVGHELGAPSAQLEGPIRPWLQILVRAPWRIYATSPATAARAVRRRRARKARRRVGDGLAVYDGVTVAAWFIPYLAFARAHGWRGRLTSGYRTPEYSEHLCYEMCGAASCAGRCAGRASHHSQKRKPEGSIDVTDSAKFGDLMAICPLEPRIFNALAPRDVVHFSATGN